MADKADVVLIGVPKKHIVDGLQLGPFNLHVVGRRGRRRRADRQGRRRTSAAQRSPARRDTHDGRR